MAADNMRDLLDELNSNVLSSAIQGGDLTKIKDILEGYKVQIEEDKVWYQNDRENKAMDINKELKELEMKVRMEEINQRREQFILENEFRKDELKIKKEMHDDEMIMRNHENHREIDANDIRMKEIEVKKAENRINLIRMIVENVIKGTALTVGTFLSLKSIYYGNEGVLNKSIFDIVQSLTSRKV